MSFEGSPLPQEGSPHPFYDMLKKGQLIGAMLDDMVPFIDDLPFEVAEALDIERLALVESQGWGQMSVPELERIYLEAGNESLPY